MTPRRPEPAPASPPALCLAQAARLTQDKVLNPQALSGWPGSASPRCADEQRIDADGDNRPAGGGCSSVLRNALAACAADVPVLVVLAAGKGTRFGTEPKCIQPVRGLPLARHSIEAFRRIGPASVVCLVGHRHEDVARALGEDVVYVRSENPTGGTAFAAFEAFSIAELRVSNPLLVITMGDRIVPDSVFRKLVETHRAAPREADLTFLSALYTAPGNRGKGRVVRDGTGCVQRIVEQRDIDALPDAAARRRLDSLDEGNCPLYAARADTFHRCLSRLTNTNAQHQFYLTDIVEAISRDGGLIRTVTASPAEPEYDVLCADVTRPADLARLEEALAKVERFNAGSGQSAPVRLGDRAGRTSRPASVCCPDAVRALTADRPPAQAAAIARQLEALLDFAAREDLGFAPDRPVAIGVAGGRLRIAFMHPDMARFFGPAWQMPMGAGHPEGSEQIVMLVQRSSDGSIRLHPIESRYRERLDSVAADLDAMYPGQDVIDPNTYEAFGTRMSETLLRLQGYLTDGEVQQLRARGQTVPPAARWVGANLRRPWPLVANALASLRTLRTEEAGARVQASLGRAGFRGLRIASTGSIPEGGFSSSSALTVATLNALDALYGFALAPETLVRLACQAEYGTGVRAGSLDQATEQTGKAGLGTLISSNPRDHYRTLGVFPVPTERIHILFPSSVARDREAWRWAWGAYAEAPAPGRLTAQEMRKMTGKAAEIAALWTRLPLDRDFFQFVQEELVRDGALSRDGARWIASILLQLPLHIRQTELEEQLQTRRAWFIEELARVERVPTPAARDRFQTHLASLLAGWRDPVLRRTTASGEIVADEGLPLRATMAYLFGETAKNFRLIHHPDEWIACVTASQRGDRCVDIAPQILPPRDAMESSLPWEAGAAGPALLDLWLDRFGATPFDFNRGLDDAALAASDPPQFHRLEGSNFFRGLALIDLAEAMLKRAFGANAVAVRVNAAGQGDFFQVHVDREKADVREVKQFIRLAFYRRFGLAPETEFVEAHPGGGAAGVRLDRYDALPDLVRHLESLTAKAQTAIAPAPDAPPHP
ncbi:MAG TPA: NTP transferase domain-containing protein [Candidatus Paceibacterota bacterium]|nr:NTP transferase domain-containing protein [Candidatus Paceibacterota bacterium]HRZ57375.1 NTP transferase domain-containing protein [Candidatus Paceibacterota bacterium]